MLTEVNFKIIMTCLKLQLLYFSLYLFWDLLSMRDIEMKSKTGLTYKLLRQNVCIDFTEYIQWVQLLYLFQFGAHPSEHPVYSLNLIIHINSSYIQYHVNAPFPIPVLLNLPGIIPLKIVKGLLLSSPLPWRRSMGDMPVSWWPPSFGRSGESSIWHWPISVSISANDMGSGLFTEDSSCSSWIASSGSLQSIKHS